MRATAAYRKTVAANLLEKALTEISGASAPTRIGMLHAAEDDFALLARPRLQWFISHCHMIPAPACPGRGDLH